MDPAQSALLNAAGNISEKVARFTERHEYVAALELIATLRPQIDRFFEEVMVMVDDPSVRNTRLSLLDSLVKTFSMIADFFGDYCCGIGRHIPGAEAPSLFLHVVAGVKTPAYLRGNDKNNSKAKDDNSV